MRHLMLGGLSTKTGGAGHAGEVGDGLREAAILARLGGMIPKFAFE